MAYSFVVSMTYTASCAVVVIHQEHETPSHLPYRLAYVTPGGLLLLEGLLRHAGVSYSWEKSLHCIRTQGIWETPSPGVLFVIVKYCKGMVDRCAISLLMTLIM